MKKKESFQKIDHYEETKFYIKILSFIDEGTDDYFFIWDIVKDRIYFSNRITKQYALNKQKDYYDIKQ